MCGQEEHEAIVRDREDPDAGLTWAEYKSMTFTYQVSLTGTSYQLSYGANCVVKKSPRFAAETNESLLGHNYDSGKSQEH